MAFSILLACFLLLSLLLLLVSYSLLTANGSQDRAPWPRLPPGPTRLPIIGNLHRLGKFPHRSLHKLSQKHGPLMYLKLGSMPTAVASSAEVAKEILKTHDLDCCTRPYFTSAAKLSYGCADVAFSPYGGLWRELRKICIIEFFSSKKVQLFQSIREQEVERMVESISTSSTSEASFNLSAALVSLSNNITCRAALGRRYYDEGEMSEGCGLHDMLKESQAMLAGFFFADYVPALGWLDKLTGMRGRLDKNFRDLDVFYERVIGEHMEKGRDRDEQGEDTMDALLRKQTDATHLTKENIKGVLMNIFLGGSDTTSSALEWAMAELMRHPEAMKKVQDEVRSFIGNKGKVEEEDLCHLAYMKCVLKEVFRVHPPVPLLVQRETMRRCVISGFAVPAKTRVLVNAFAIGRDEGSWKDPEEFRPERFVENAVDMKGHDFELLPFGGGRRICPGMHVGMAVVELVLANLVYSFDWELPRGMSKEDIRMDEEIGVAVHRKFALRLVATKYSTIVV